MYDSRLGRRSEDANEEEDELVWTPCSGWYRRYMARFIIAVKVGDIIVRGVEHR